MDWHGTDGWGWAMMAFALIFGLALLGLLFWGISEWVRPRERVSGGVQRRPDESPREILDRRLAGGEIDIETYERALEALARRHEPAPK